MLSVSLNCTMANTPCEHRHSIFEKIIRVDKQLLLLLHILCCLQLSDLVFIHDNIADRPKLLKVLSDVSLRDFKIDATDEHTVLLLSFSCTSYCAQRLMLPPLHMLLHTRDYQSGKKKKKKKINIKSEGMATA